MSGFTFLLFLSVFVFGVCVAPIHRYWEVGAFLAKYGVSNPELFECYLRNLDLVYGYVDYQEDKLVVDHNTIKSLLQTVQSSTVCNLPYSLFGIVENDPVKLRAFVLNLMTMLSIMGDESSEEFFLLLDLEKRLDLASGLSLFSTQPKLINGTHILNKRGVAVVYRLNNVSVYRSHLDRCLYYLQWYDDGANVIPTIATVRRELAELDAAGVTPRSVSWCSIKPVEDTTDTQLQLRYAMLQIRENQKYLDRVANATLPETIQEKKNLATYWTVVMGKMQDLAVQRHSEYAAISVSDRETYFNSRLETLADTSICRDVYQIKSAGVCVTYVQLLSRIDMSLAVSHTRQFNAALDKIGIGGVSNEESPDIPIKYVHIPNGQQREEFYKHSLEIIIGYLATSGPLNEARRMEFGMLSTYQKLFATARGLRVY